MEKILLFSDDEKLFEITKQVTEGKQELVWGNYQCLETNRYPFVDVVIMHFDEDKIRKDTILIVLLYRIKIARIIWIKLDLSKKR